MLHYEQQCQIACNVESLTTFLQTARMYTYANRYRVVLDLDFDWSPNSQPRTSESNCVGDIC